MCIVYHSLMVALNFFLSQPPRDGIPSVYHHIWLYIFFILLLITLLNLDYVPLFLCGCLKNNRHLFLPTLWIINSLLLYMQYRKFLTVKFISHLVVCATVVQHLCIPMLHILQNAITTCLCIHPHIYHFQCCQKNS